MVDAMALLRPFRWAASQCPHYSHCGQALPHGRNLDMVVKHVLNEVGMHTLNVHVKYRDMRVRG